MDAITTFFINALAAGLGVAAVEWYWKSRDRGDSSAFQALRIALILEGYARSCADLIQENKNADHFPGEQFPDWDSTLPPLPEYPDDIDGWRAIPSGLSAGVLGLRNKALEFQSLVNSVTMYTPEDVGTTVNECAANLGFEAWELAEKLRSKFGHYSAEPKWDYPAYLKASRPDHDTNGDVGG